MKKTLLRSLLVILVIAMLLPGFALADEPVEPAEPAAEEEVPAETPETPAEPEAPAEEEAPAGLPSEINVVVNGETVIWTDAVPFIDENNRTLVPLRATADAMGLDVAWDQATKTATFSISETVEDPVDPDFGYTRVSSVSFTLNSSVALWNDVTTYFDGEVYDAPGEVQMDTAAVIIDGRIYAPIRYLAEYIGYGLFFVNWDAETRTVLIDSPTYYCDYDFYAVEGGLCLMLVPSSDYDRLASHVISSVAVDGEAVDFYVLTEEEIVAMTEKHIEEWGYDPVAVYCVAIAGDYINMSGSYDDDFNYIPACTIEFVADYTLLDGTETSEVFTLAW